MKGKKKNKSIRGTIRVARWNVNWKFPKIEGYTSIIVLVKSTQIFKEEGENFWMLGPYHLCDKKGRIMENLWQFSKLYDKTPSVSIPYSSRSNQIVWKREETVFIDPVSKKINEEYKKWRKEGQENEFPVRNPVGWGYLKHCIGSVCEEDLSTFSTIEEGKEKGVILDYISARKKIYLSIYSSLVKEKKEFWQLKDRLERGENLLIIEQDGPHFEGNYTEITIDKDTHSVEINEHTISILIEDTRFPFGHGYCLAINLLDIDY